MRKSKSIVKWALCGLMALSVNLALPQLAMAQSNYNYCIDKSAVQMQNSNEVWSNCGVPMKVVFCYQMHKTDKAVCETTRLSTHQRYQVFNKNAQYSNDVRYWVCRLDEDCGPKSSTPIYSELIYSSGSDRMTPMNFTPCTDCKGSGSSGANSSGSADKSQKKNTAGSNNSLSGSDKKVVGDSKGFWNATRCVRVEQSGYSTTLRNDCNDQIEVSFCSPDKKSNYYNPRAGRYEGDGSGHCAGVRTSASGGGGGEVTLKPNASKLISSFQADADSRFFWGACGFKGNVVALVRWREGGGFDCR